MKKVRAAMTATVAIEGRITVTNSDEMRRKLQAALRSRPAQILVDLAQATYLDTSAVATLLEAVRIARRQGTLLLLSNLSGQPQSLFAAAGLDPLFDFAPQEKNA
jgi:anti-sigma B factor antagonist